MIMAVFWAQYLEGNPKEKSQSFDIRKPGKSHEPFPTSVPKRGPGWFVPGCLNALIHSSLC